MSDLPLPAGWVKKISSRTGSPSFDAENHRFIRTFLGKEYYIDPVTRESQWEHPSLTGGKSSSRKPAAGGDDQVQALHILVKHTGSRNPKNYKGETITRSKDEARRRLDGSFICSVSEFFKFVLRRNHQRIEECHRSRNDVSTHRQREK